MKKTDLAPSVPEDVTLGEVYRLVLKIDSRLDVRDEEMDDLKTKVSIHDWAIGILGISALAAIPIIYDLIKAIK